MWFLIIISKIIFKLRNWTLLINSGSVFRDTWKHGEDERKSETKKTKELKGRRKKRELDSVGNRETEEESKI